MSENAQYEYLSRTLVINGNFDAGVLIEFLRLSASETSDTENKIKTILLNSGGG